MRVRNNELPPTTKNYFVERINSKRIRWTNKRGHKVPQKWTGSPHKKMCHEHYVCVCVCKDLHRIGTERTLAKTIHPKSMNTHTGTQQNKYTTITAHSGNVTYRSLHRSRSFGGNLLDNGLRGWRTHEERTHGNGLCSYSDHFGHMNYIVEVATIQKAPVSKPCYGWLHYQSHSHSSLKWMDVNWIRSTKFAFLSTIINRMGPTGHFVWNWVQSF